MIAKILTDFFQDGTELIAIIDEWYQYVVNIDVLERWLDSKGLLDCISDDSVNGEHEQHIWKMTFDQWKDSRYMDKDLVNAINEMGIKPELIN
jgi:hypothetical protein